MTAPNSEGPACQPTPQGKTSKHVAIVADAACLYKHDATLIATAALAGFELRRLADGRWIVSRWNLHRELPDADAVRVFLVGAGVRS